MAVTVTDLKKSRATLVKIRDHAENGIVRIDAQLAKMSDEKPSATKRKK